jgi:purine-nucleoside phosphorylase
MVNEEDVSTPHINAKKGDFAPVVLMPGDPLRAKWIAEAFLKDVKQVNSTRGMLGYTGYTSEKKRVSVMSSGMGMPSIGIYSHELFTSYGVEAIIRIGTCGTYQKDVNLKDLIIAQGACTDSNWMSQHHLFNGTFSAISDFGLLEEAVNQARSFKVPFHVGNIVSCDIFYDYRPDNWKKWANLGVLGVEMEAYALFEQAAVLHKKALAICTVSDSFINNDKRLSKEERQAGLQNMVEVALGVANKFSKE